MHVARAKANRRAVALILIKAVLLSFSAVLTGCGKRQYSRNDNYAVFENGKTLYIVVDHIAGYDEKRNGMSHQLGVVVTQQDFLLFEYDLDAVQLSPLHAKSVRLLFSCNNDDHYRFRLSSKTTILSTRSARGIDIIQNVSPESRAPRNVISVSDKEHILGNPPFFTDRDLAIVFPNRSPVQAYDAASLEIMKTNPLESLMNSSSFRHAARDKGIIIAEGSGSVGLIPERIDSGIIIYAPDGEHVSESVPLPTDYIIRDVQLDSKGVGWLCQSSNIVIKESGQTNLFQIAMTGFAEWHPERSSIFVVPFEFNLYSKGAFETPLKICDYKSDNVKRFRLDYDDFLASANRRWHISP